MVQLEEHNTFIPYDEIYNGHYLVELDEGNHEIVHVLDGEVYHFGTDDWWSISDYQFVERIQLPEDKR
jgi:hypothetical protein